MYIGPFSYEASSGEARPSSLAMAIYDGEKGAEN